MAIHLKSLKATNNSLREPKEQLKFLNNGIFENTSNKRFNQKLAESSLYPVQPKKLEIFQVNIGYMCNQTCSHCHVDAGPDRKEIMGKETMIQCIEAIKISGAKTVDITGGAPEMNPDFKWFIEQLSTLKIEVIVRSNLTIIVSNKKYNALPEFFAKHRVRVVSSLPYFSKRRTDNQRGHGVFDKSLLALKMLNERGYGKKQTGLILDLVYNPAGAFLPGDQIELENTFRMELKKYSIEFSQLLAITNLPISRFLDYLIKSDNYVDYMQLLIDSYNPAAVENVMCRNTISVDWEGNIFDCDFNQMLDLKVNSKSNHLDNFDSKLLSDRNIVLNQHCFGCTAGAGSSCQGATI